MSTTLSQQIKFLSQIEKDIESDTHVKLTPSLVTLRINKPEDSLDYMIQKVTVLRAAIALDITVSIYGIPANHGN